ncbi:MAG: uroporphyrinogen-III C-methyltransferase [Gammaproteobacteria bacterium]|nr:uroporphyrinogen-III C-methyltransferase [Gammaproteobacteria bacterium]
MTSPNKNEQEKKSEKKSVPEKKPVTQTSSGSQALIVGMILLALVLVVAGLGWQHYHALEKKVVDQISAINSLQTRSQEQASVIKQLRTTEQTFAEMLDGLKKELGNDKAGRAHSEAIYLIHLANHRLRFQQDTQTAIIMLSEADRIINKAGDASLIKLREALANDIAALKNINMPDVTGMSLTLNSLASTADALTLKKQVKEKIQTDSAETISSESGSVTDWKQFVFALWDNIKQLVVIRRTETGAAPLLAPQEQYFLYQNLQLKLESTRLSLLKADTTAFHTNIDVVTDWLVQYFDTNATSVKNIIDTLTTMKQVDLSPALPELTSLAVMNNTRGATDQ